jgi:hypothetical protein
LYLDFYYCRWKITNLLECHRLGSLIPDTLMEALAKEMQRAVALQPRPKKLANGEQAPRKRLAKTLTHAIKLRQYKERPFARAAGVSTRYRSLNEELNH